VRNRQTIPSRKVGDGGQCPKGAQSVTSPSAFLDFDFQMGDAEPVGDVLDALADLLIDLEGKSPATVEQTAAGQ